MSFTKLGSMVLGWALLICAFVQIGEFAYQFYLRIEPDWLSMFKLICNFFLLSSAITIIVGIFKVNVTIVLVSELMILITTFGYALYFGILIILFLISGILDEVFTIFLGQSLPLLGLYLFCAIVFDCLRRQMEKEAPLKVVEFDEYGD